MISDNCTLCDLMNILYWFELTPNDIQISEHEFLQNSTKFAQNLGSEEKMYMRFRKILGPLTTDFEKICQDIYDLEAKK